ncbi:MAG: PASTA domain-containing protein, partial [Bdellovibrio sp.]
RKAYYGSTVAAPVFARIASYAVRKEGIAPLRLSEETVARKEKQVAAINKIMDSVREPAATALVADNTVPDLSRLTMREVLRRFSGQEVKVKFVGRGLVSEVQPAPGAPLPENKEITVILR